MGIVNKNITLDIDSMTTEEKKQFENLVSTLDFFSIESDPPPTQGSGFYHSRFLLRYVDLSYIKTIDLSKR